ncbi:MAG TPA: surface-adhesin E family protein [Gemmatimonadaceae bacterium]|nr:surface-adhesin E family protein [Gemmatimonadaceae bacterium]
MTDDTPGKMTSAPLRLARTSALVLLLCAGSLLMGCSRDHQGQSGHAGSSKATAGMGWAEIVSTPGLVVYLDTSRVNRQGDGSAQIWFRFVYTPPATFGSDTSMRYAASEMHEQLDCAHRRTKDLALELETTGGTRSTTPTRDPRWISIDSHALGAPLFVVACDKLGSPISVMPGM